MITGTVGIALAFAWLVYTFRVFGGFPTAIALILYLAAVAWMACEFALFTGLLAWIGPLPLGLGAPLVFTAVEFLFPSFFPWRLAHSQYRLPILIQTGDLAGPYLLTFVVVWTSTGVLAVYRRLTGRGSHPISRTTIVAPALALIAVVAYGRWRLADVRAERTAAPALRLGVVQGNIDIVHKDDPQSFTRNLEEYRALSRRVAADADVLVWPETVLLQPVPLDQAQLRADDHGPFGGAARPLLFGALGVVRRAGKLRLTNSAFLLGEDGAIAGRYDKRVLMPFGEYMPLGERFPSLRALSPATAAFAAGERQTVLTVGSGANLGVLICYEDLVPGSARAAVAAGAHALVNLTNDAWYGHSAAALQHQVLALWRAVETRRDLVRATNTGVTSLIGATGEVLAELPTFESRTLVAEIRLLTERTVYAAVGDVFAWSVVAVFAVVLLQKGIRAGHRP